MGLTSHAEIPIPALPRGEIAIATLSGTMDDVKTLSVSFSNMLVFESELYPIDFQDPPRELKSRTILAFWYTSRKIRRIVQTSPWWERLNGRGQQPYFCFHDEFCACFETKQELEDHYREFQEHRLTKEQIQARQADAQIVQMLRKWSFPRNKHI